MPRDCGGGRDGARIRRRPSVADGALCCGYQGCPNTEAEKADIKAGRIPETWQDKRAKVRQKDRDARRTLVFGTGASDARSRARSGRRPSHNIRRLVWLDRRCGCA